jgi:hypothetical protein
MITMFEEPITDSNFLMYAIKNYHNPECCDMEEFNEDINRIKYIKRLLRRYNKTRELRERLILNHIIILGNLFTPKVASRILMFKLEEELHIYLKTFLVFLEFIPEDGIMDEVPLDNKIISALRSL